LWFQKISIPSLRRIIIWKFQWGGCVSKAKTTKGKYMKQKWNFQRGTHQKALQPIPEQIIKNTPVHGSQQGYVIYRFIIQVQ